MTFPTNLTNAVAGVTEIKAEHLNNLEAKIGIDGSGVVTSLDYLLKNAASINPGHGHTLAALTDVTALPAELNLLDLAGLTAGHVLRATGAAAAAWGAIQAGDLPTGIDAAKIADGSVGNAEFQCLANVTSDIQSQLTGKASLTGATFTGAIQPNANNAYACGSSSCRWSHLYATKLNLSFSYENGSSNAILSTNNATYSNSGTYYGRGAQIIHYVNPNDDLAANNAGYDRGVHVVSMIRNDAGVINELTGIFVEYGAYGYAGADLTSTTTTAYGIRISGSKVASSTITTNYGLHIGGVFGASAYGIYQGDVGIKNYFASSIHLGGKALVGTNGLKVLAIGNGTAPASSVADSAQIYSADQVAGNACIHTRTENGAIIKLFQGEALTAALTTLTYTAPGTPDYAIQDLTNSGGYGFVTKDEGNTVLSIIANLQTRINELEARLKAHGLLA